MAIRSRPVRGAPELSIFVSSYNTRELVRDGGIDHECER
jgi:hypothetical protein